MIQLHTYRTSNGRKASIALEELGLDYTTHIVDITRGDQHAEAFRKISPNGRIPAIVDEAPEDGGDPLSVFESGAILIYLAEKSGRLLPSSGVARVRTLEWLNFQMGGVGPMFGQAFHFLHQTPDNAPEEALAYGRTRYGGEVRRLMRVMNTRLDENAFLAGGDYTIADTATYPWVAIHKWFEIDLAADFPNLARWAETVGARPAVQRGMDIPSWDAIKALEGEKG